MFGKKKKLDIICKSPDCNFKYSHKDVEWEKRTFNPAEIGNEESQKIAKEAQEITGNYDEITASPNQIFEYLECEYCSECPMCNFSNSIFWFGKESLSKQGDKLPTSVIQCPNCNENLPRVDQLWFNRFGLDDDDKWIEILSTICPKCNKSLSMPSEYVDFNKGIIQ